MAGRKVFVNLPVIVGLSMIVSALMGGVIGYQIKSANVKEAETKTVIKTEYITKMQPVVTEKVVTKYVDRVIEIEGKGLHVTEIIERTAPSADCRWPEYYRRLHDAAARGDAPPDAPRTGDEAKTLEAASTFTTIDQNYRTCHTNAAQLEALQDWIRKQRELAR
jgi:hypothetical protein